MSPKNSAVRHPYVSTRKKLSSSADRCRLIRTIIRNLMAPSFACYFMIPFSESAVKDGQNGKTGEAGASGFSPTATKNTQFVLASLGRLCYTKLYAGVMELADVVDSKSTASDGVPVRVRPPAP